MKLSKKLLMASATLGLAFTATVGSTYAWFAANTNVSVTGMGVKSKVSGNILISETNAEAAFSTALSQSRTALLEPASTVNGINFFYTTNAAGDGSAAGEGASKYTTYAEATNAVTEENTGHEYYDAAFNDTYSATPSSTSQTTAFAYVDYSFYLKATSSEANQNLVLSRCNMLYNGAAITQHTAWRVGVYAVSTSKETTVTDATCAAVGNKKTILTLAGAANFESGKAVSSTSGTGAVEYNTASTTIGTIAAAGTTAYYKVVVRLWLEGEDTTCTTDTFAALTNEYTLDLTFSLSNSSTYNVTAIGSSAS